MKFKLIQKKQKGFSLIEVLITLVIASLGLLGFAGLQLAALQNNRIALQRSFATLNAYDIIDSMRANRVQANASNYNQSYGATPVSGTIAGDDLIRWNTAIARDLALGQGSITVNGNIAEISIRWKEGAESTNPYIVWTTVTTL